jgi:hypothetical protein
MLLNNNSPPKIISGCREEMRPREAVTRGDRIALGSFSLGTVLVWPVPLKAGASQVGKLLRLARVHSHKRALR